VFVITLYGIIKYIKWLQGSLIS